MKDSTLVSPAMERGPMAFTRAPGTPGIVWRVARKKALPARSADNGARSVLMEPGAQPPAPGAEEAAAALAAARALQGAGGEVQCSEGEEEEGRGGDAADAAGWGEEDGWGEDKDHARGGARARVTLSERAFVALAEQGGTAHPAWAQAQSWAVV